MVHDVIPHAILLGQTFELLAFVCVCVCVCMCGLESVGEGVRGIMTMTVVCSLPLSLY